ncbi:MAG: DEAD/DEAH box helicase [Candidatus Kapaibacteriales bacterium]
MNNSFADLGLSPQIINAISDLGFENPTPVQQEVIPVALEDERDIVALAQTGTGKTAAFGLPVLQEANPNNNSVQTLILSPTRELCIQIAKDIGTFSKYIKGLKCVAVYGGESVQTQLNELRRGAHIIVATPGRMGDFLRRKAIDISELENLVLDEADEMLNMGFKDELDFILSHSPKEKRTMLFSATMAGEVERIANTYLRDPLKITVGNRNETSSNIFHVYYQVQEKDRYLALKRIADMNPDIYGLVFCRTRMETKRVAEKFMKDGYSADALHGDLNQNQRDAVMKKFRDKTIQMLVATDVAARGIDVSDITHVINYNLPEEPEVYTHRSGRTGRAGKSGVCISIINARENFKVKKIERQIGNKIEKEMVPSGEQVCKRQLFSLIDNMMQTEVDEENIEPFMERVNKKLAHMDKEEVVKKFLSIEFNRFIQYYQDAPDLNLQTKGRQRQDDSYEGGRDRGSRSGRSRGSRGGSSGFDRFFVNLGNKDGLQPNLMIKFINKHVGDRSVKIGEIDIKDSFSFIEIGKEHGSTVKDALTGKKLRDRVVRLEESEPRKKSEGGEQRGGGGFRSSGDRNKKHKKRHNKNKGMRRS